MDEKATFGAWVKRRRKALYMTQPVLASRVGCSVSAITKIESGERRPSRQIAVLLVKYLEIAAGEHEHFLLLARSPGEVLTPPPNNLPAPLTSLVGREAEIAALRGMLLGEARLLTLVGPGGIGKTRLGLEAARATVPFFKDGTYFVALASIADPSLVASAVMQTLGLSESSSQPLAESLKAHLRNRQVLLILDNFEQILSAGPLINELLAAAPSLKVLATSRSRLHLYGEQQFQVPALSLPGIGVRATDELIGCDAIRLFEERARLVQPGFTLAGSPEQAVAAAEICRRLDGVPLAIELAAARANILSPVTMLGRFDTPLDILIDGPHDLTPRQQTMSGAIAWSYNLLEEPDRTIFRNLSPFVGGWTVESADEVCGSGDGRQQNTLAFIESLVDKSLVQTYRGSHATVRFRMLETIRAYASSIPAKSDQDRGILMGKYTEYFADLAERAELELVGAEQAVWLARLEDEHDNLRAVLAIAREEGDAEMALRIAGALWRFWLVRGYYSEGRDQLAQALAIPTERQGMNGDLATLRARALNGAGILAWRQNDYNASRLYSEQSLTIYRGLGDKQGIAQALNNLGNLAHRHNDHATARALFEESLALRRALDDNRGVADSLNNLAMVVDELGDYETAQGLYEESLGVRRQIGDRRGVANSLNNIALVSWEHGDCTRARTILEESLILYKELGDKRGAANALNNIGLVAWEMGDYAGSLPFYRESLERYTELEDKHGITDCLDGLARVASSLGDPRRAARVWGAAEALRESIGISIPPSDLAEYQGNIESARVRLDPPAWQAAWQAGRAMTLERAVSLALESSQEYE